jgi:hypothetical protein
MTRVAVVLFATSIAGCVAPTTKTPSPSSSPARECLDYLACINQVNTNAYAGALLAYGPGSTCWTSDATIHEQCRHACAQSLEQTQELVGGCADVGGGGGAGGTAMGKATDIDKTGSYDGPKSDPMLSSPAACPDGAIEPNDALTTALGGPALTLDAPTTKIVQLSICPAAKGDIDYFRVTAPSAGFIQADLFYDIEFGDLDLAILDDKGTQLAADGSAVSNGCTSAPASANRSYFVIVKGAAAGVANRYELRIRLRSSASCP